MKNLPDKAPFWVVDQTSRRFWEAYVRIAEGKPNIVSERARMTLSSVATEAGFQRSTLSRRRFPDLAELIDKKTDQTRGKSMYSLYQQKQAANRKLRDRLNAIGLRQSVLLNRVAELAHQHFAMSGELERLREETRQSTVTSISSNPGIAKSRGLGSR